MGLKGQARDAEALEKALEVWEKSGFPLRQLELYTAPGGDTLLVVLTFNDARTYTVNRPRVVALAKQVPMQLVEIGNFTAEQRTAFQSELSKLPWRTQGDVSIIFSEWRNIGKTPVLRMSFDSEAELLQAWARHVTEGALWVPTSRPSESQTLSVTFVTPTGEWADNEATRVDKPAPRGARAGLWLKMAPGPALQEALARMRTKDVKRSGKAPTPSAPLREVPPSEVRLDYRIATPGELAARYASDISRGGIFIPTPHPPPLRSRVQFRLTLPNSEVLVLPAEVVHRVEGREAGVGLQFVAVGPTTFAAIEALLVEPPRQPKVLVIDDEAIWRTSLSRVLQGLGAEVIVAHDGQEGLMKLIDGYFDLDLVILDLNMPHLDGRSLINRVRTLGGDSALKMFLFSGIAKEELKAIGEAGLCNGVFSKLDSVDVLKAQLAKELQLKGGPSTRS